jgi:hypothetical protein
VCRLDRACAECCRADSERDGREERTRRPGTVGGMAFVHRRTCSFQYPYFLEDIRGGFNSSIANNHFAERNERISIKRLENERYPIAITNQIPLVNE